MPNRYLRENLKTSERIDRISDAAFRLYVHLIVTVDDFGRHDGRLSILWPATFPIRATKPDPARLDALLEELRDADLIHRYEVYGEPYLMVKRVDPPRAKKSKCPPPEDYVNTPANTPARTSANTLANTSAPYSNSNSITNSVGRYGNTRQMPACLSSYPEADRPIVEALEEAGIVPPFNDYIDAKLKPFDIRRITEKAKAKGLGAGAIVIDLRALVVAAQRKATRAASRAAAAAVKAEADKAASEATRDEEARQRADHAAATAFVSSLPDDVLARERDAALADMDETRRRLMERSDPRKSMPWKLELWKRLTKEAV
jgi:hypothetical protein